MPPVLGTTGQLIAAEARSWVGTPLVWQGRLKGVGVDCKGLIAGVAAECRRPEAESVEALAGDYGKVVDSRRLTTGLARLFDHAPVDAIEPGDVLLLRISGKPQHLAIALGEGEMVHCYGAGIKPRVLIAAIPRAKLDSVWRWKDLGTDLSDTSPTGGMEGEARTLVRSAPSAAGRRAGLTR